MNPTPIVSREEDLATIVRGMRIVGVVGAKGDGDPDAPAYSIPRLLQQAGRRVIPINPTIAETLGEKTLASVSQLSGPVDVLDVFRRVDAIPALTDEILAMPAELRPRVVWLQSGIRHDASAERLAATGIRVVQDRCLGVYLRRYP